MVQWTAAGQASLSCIISWSLLKLTSIEWMKPSNHLIMCCPFSSCSQSFPSSESFPMSQLFRSGGQVLELQISIIPSNDYSELISFRIDWFDFLAVQGILKSLLYHNNSKASMLRCSTFIMVQLSHPCVTTGKTIGLTIWTFISKVMSLLFNMLSRIVIAFVSRGKHLLISWLQSPSTVILEPMKIKSDTVSTFSPSVCHEMIEPDATILFF